MGGDQELSIQITTNAERAASGMNAVIESLGRIEKALASVTSTLETAVQKAGTISRAMGKLSNAINSLNPQNIDRTAKELDKVGASGETAARGVRKATDAVEQTERKLAMASSMITETFEKSAMAVNADAYERAVSGSEAVARASRDVAEGAASAVQAVQSLVDGYSGLGTTGSRSSEAFTLAATRIGEAVQNISPAIAGTMSAMQAYADYVDRAFRGDMGEDAIRRYVSSMMAIPGQLAGSLALIPDSMSRAATVVDGSCQEISSAAGGAAESIRAIPLAIGGINSNIDAVEISTAEMNSLGEAVERATAGAKSFVDTLLSDEGVTGLGADARWTDEQLQEVLKRMNEYSATINGMKREKIPADVTQLEEAVIGLEKLKTAFNEYMDALKSRARESSALSGQDTLGGETAAPVIDVEETERALTAIEKVVAQLSEYKRAIRGFEGGNVEIGEDAYRRALVEVEKLSAKLKEYKETVLAANRELDATSSEGSGSFDGVVEASDEASAHIQEVLRSIREYEAAIADMKALRAPFDDTAFRELTEKLAAARQEWADYMASVRQAGETRMEEDNPPQGVIDRIKEMKDELEQAAGALRMLSSLFGGLASVSETAFRASFTPVNATMATLKGMGAVFADLGSKIASLANPIKNTVAAAKSGIDDISKKLKAGWAKITRTAKFMLVRKAITAILKTIGEAMKSLAQFAGETGQEFNKSMSLLVSDAKYVGANIVAAFAPIINMIAPVIDFLVEKLTVAIEYINMFFAALSGRDIYVRAKKRMEDFGKGAEDSAEKMKSLNKQLMSFDKLNNITTNDKGGEATNPWGEWEERPISEKIKEFAEKVKGVLKDLFEPLKKAWDIAGEYVISGFKYMLERLGSLFKDMGRDFLEVWKSPEMVNVFAEILMIIGDIERIIGAIAERIHIAWNRNKVGKKMFEDIRDIVGVIVKHLHQASQDTLAWAKSLNFYPAFKRIEEALAKIAVALDPILQILNNAFKEVVLPSLKWILENGFPRFMKFVGDIIEGVGNLARKFLEAWDNLEFGKGLFAGLVGIMNVLLMHVENIGEKFREWGANVDFEPLLASVLSLVEALRPVADFIGGVFEDVFTNVVLPFVQFLVEEAIPALNKALTDFAEAVHWDELRSKVGALLAAFEGLLEAFTGGLIKAVGDFGKSLAEFTNGDVFTEFMENITRFLNSITPDMIANVLGGIGKAVIDISEAVMKFVNSDLFQGLLNAVLYYLQNTSAEDIASKIIGLANAIIAFKFAEFMTAGFANFLTFVAGIPAMVMNFQALGGVIGTVAGYFLSFASNLGIIGGAITAVVEFVGMLNEGFSMAREVIMLAGLAVAATCAVIVGAVPAATAAIIAGVVGALATAIVLIKEHWNEINEWTKQIGDAMMQWAENVDSAVKQWFSDMGDAISQKLTEIKEWASQTWTNIVNGIKEKAAAAKQAADEFGANLKKGIDERLKAIMDSVAAFIERVKTRFSVANLKAEGRKFINSFLEGLREAWNSIVKWIEDKLRAVKNMFSNALKSIKMFGSFGTASSIPGYASGGYPQAGTLFWAGEGGVPEMMGTVGGKSAVAGGAEITGIRDEIRNASVNETALLRQEVELLRQLVAKDFGISSKDIFNSVRGENREYRMRTGRSAFAT